MHSLPLNKRSFAKVFKNDKNFLNYVVTTVALMLTLLFHGVINGNLKLEHFLYALIVSALFSIWALIDHKCRKYFKYKNN